MAFDEQVEQLGRTVNDAKPPRPNGTRRALLGITALVMGAASLGYALASREPEHIPGQLIVGFENEVSLTSEADGNVLTGLSAVDAINRSLEGESYEALAPASAEYELDNIFLLDVEDSANLPRLMSRLSAAPGVEFVTYDMEMSLLDEPNDPFWSSSGSWKDKDFSGYGDLWGLQRTNIQAAWDITKGSDDLIIAIIDTGIAPHPDLEGRLMTGYNAIDGSDNTRDGHGHGTHVAGTILAVHNNGIGIVGVMDRGRLMPIKVLSDSGSGSLFGVAQGIIYAGKNGADVANMSLGGPAGPAQRVLDEAISYSVSKGTIFVVAAGNNDQDAIRNTPANNPQVITMAALTPDLTRTYFSAFGSKVTAGAPGWYVLSTVPDQNKVPRRDPNDPNAKGYPCIESQGALYCAFHGTSMASPHGAGLVGLMLAANPELGGDFEAVRGIIRETSNPVREEAGKPVNGSIDYGAAVQAAAEYGR